MRDRAAEGGAGEPLRPEDSPRLREILERDQRTTCHRVVEQEARPGRRGGQRRAARDPSELVSAPECPSSAEEAREGDGRRARCCCSGEAEDARCRRRGAPGPRDGPSGRATAEPWRRRRGEEDCGRCAEEAEAKDGAPRRPKNYSSCSTWLRLGGLLVALLAVTVQSAPTTMSLENSRRLGSPPKWTNPCGFASEEFDGDVDVVQLNDETLLGNIVMQARTALNYAQGFRDDYIKRTFNTDYADLHSTWKDNHYDWLPGPRQIPKELGEQLDPRFLDRLEMRMLDTALLDAYEFMQRYAVGLEQVAWDQEDYNLEFRKQFKDTEYNLRSVLCELQMALVERNVLPRADVSRDIMSSAYRGISNSATFRNLRDWLIFRDYMNALEYIVQVLEHFVERMKS